VFERIEQVLARDGRARMAVNHHRAVAHLNMDMMAVGVERRVMHDQVEDIIMDVNVWSGGGAVSIRHNVSPCLPGFTHAIVPNSGRVRYAQFRACKPRPTLSQLKGRS
jgi:hypothetical protein